MIYLYQINNCIIVLDKMFILRELMPIIYGHIFHLSTTQFIAYVLKSFLKILYTVSIQYVINEQRLVVINLFCCVILK